MRRSALRSICAICVPIFIGIDADWPAIDLPLTDYCSLITDYLLLRITFPTVMIVR